jgi:hypothetical protein
MDEVTGENEAGACIAALRAEFKREKLASFFSTPEELGGLIVAAITNLERERFGAAIPSLEPRTATPERRQITSDVFIMFGQHDGDLASRFAQELSLNPNGLSCVVSSTALLARTESAFLELDFRVQACDVGAILLSTDSLATMAQESERTAEILDLVRSRTGCILALCTSPDAATAARKWEIDVIIDVSRYSSDGAAVVRDAKESIKGRTTKTSLPIIGVPLLVAAMTRTEALALCAQPEIIGRELGLDAQTKFEQITAALSTPLADRYGTRRDACRAPGSQLTLTELGREAIQKLARMNNPKLRGRAIKLQGYPFDPLVDDRIELREVYRSIAESGCVLVVDEMSMFLPAVRRALANSPVLQSRETAIMTVSPFQTSIQQPEQLLRSELRSQLRGIFDRFETDYDPMCELGVGEESRVRRWLYQSLPETMNVVRHPRADAAQLAMFAAELGVENPVDRAGLMYSRDSRGIL